MKHKKIIGGLFLSIITLSNLQAEKTNENLQDTIQSYYLDEIIVSTSNKETNDLKMLPGSISLITPSMVEGQKMVSIKSLSTVIPNLFIPDYGSKLSTPVYIRGIGERSTGQSIGLYVDNMPYMDKTVFDFDFIDIQRIEVLRGPQGTLYGRNAMSGIMNIYTQSPLQSQYTKVSLSGGSYGLFRTKVSISELLTSNVGISINAYYGSHDGYFINRQTGRKADRLQSAGGKLRLEWKINTFWDAQIAVAIDSSKQGAFPYGEYVNGNIAPIACDYPGSYARGSIKSNLNLNYRNESILFNSSTGFLFFDDNMKMDVDNGIRDIFRLNQLQKEKSWTEELTLKSNTKNNYQWSFGIFGFYTELKTDVTTMMGTNGIETILQPAFDKIHENNPRAPLMTVCNPEISIPGTFQTPTHGGAIFHQSTYNNLFVEGLSLTAGLRLDYEKTRLDYRTGIEVDLSVDRQAGTTIIHLGDSTLSALMKGNESMEFTEILPKVALKYQFNSDNYLYATVSNGYKTGGYNIQHFADIIQGALREKYDKNFQASSTEDLVPYKPEYSWNYEIGVKGEAIKDLLYAEIATFFIDVKDIQITDFVESGQGRILKNAGKARSFGLELSLTARITDELKWTANYGLTRAFFQNYITKEEKTGQTVDYSGNYLPFAPQNTFSLSAIYNKRLQQKWIDRFNFQAQYHAAGKIYWTEKNDVYQNFYGILNLKAGINKGAFVLNVWTNNTLNTNYASFYFESMGRGLAQKGKPFNFGADISFVF
jgi:outer membrane receptor protein involved in Fe transport